MTKTQNYQLNQWDAADPIRREDFNADNQKIDAALEKMTQRVPLKTVTQEAAAAQFTIDVSDVDWSRWNYVILEMTIATAESTTLHLGANGLTANCSYWGLGSAGLTSAGLSLLECNRRMEIILFPLHAPERRLSCITVHDSFCFGFSSRYKYQELTSFDAISDNSVLLNAGSIAALYGVK